MGAEKRLYFDTPKTNTYFGDLQDAITEYEKFADEHIIDVDAIISTNSWQGKDADSAKKQLSEIEKNILNEIIQLQKDVNDVDGEIIEKFYAMVDDSTEAFIDYNTIKKINSDFRAQAATFNVKVKVAEAKISDLSSKYSKYGDISTQDFTPGKTAFEELCGGEADNGGFLNLCMKKLVIFDSDAKGYIEEQKFDKKVESLTRKMCMAVSFKHPEYGLGHYVDDIDKFENELENIKLKIILNKDASKWSVEDIITVANTYKNAVDERDWRTIRDIMEGLEVTECIKGYKTREKDGELCDKYTTYLDPDKSFLILSFLHADGQGDTDAFLVLEEMACTKMEFVIPRGAYSTKPNISIHVSAKDYGVAVYWSAYRGGEKLGYYERVIFNKRGLTPKQRYDLTKDDSTLNQYNQQLKAVKDSQRLTELSNKYKNDKDYEDVVFDKEQKTKNDDRAYKFINHKSSRFGIRMFTYEYDDNCYSYLNDDEIKTYNYLYYKDGKKDTALADEYLELLIPLLRQRKAKEEYAKMSNGKGCDGLEKALYEVYVGYDSINTGIDNFYNLDDDRDGVARYTVTEYVDQLIMEKASEGEALGYKVCKCVGAMAPGAALTVATGGTATPAALFAVGSINAATYGMSAGGNAKAWAERSGYTQEQAESYGNAVAIEEALKAMAYTYLASPSGNMFANASLPVRMFGTAMTTVTVEFIDEAGVKPGMAYIILDDKDAYNNINWKDVFENCAMAGVTVVVVEGIGEAKRYYKVKVGKAAKVGKTNFENEGYCDGNEWQEYLSEKYGAENVSRNLSEVESADVIRHSEVYENTSPVREAMETQDYTADEFIELPNERQVLPGDEDFIGPLADPEHHLIFGDGIGPKKRGVLGGHNEKYFYETLESTGFSREDLLIGEPEEHPTIKGIYSQRYRLPKYDGRGNFIGFKEMDYPKTIYDPNIISDSQMIQWGKEAVHNGTQTNGGSTVGRSNNGLQFVINPYGEYQLRYYPTTR